MTARPPWDRFASALRDGGWLDGIEPTTDEGMDTMTTPPLTDSDDARCARLILALLQGDQAQLEQVIADALATGTPVTLLFSLARYAAVLSESLAGGREQAVELLQAEVLRLTREGHGTG